MNLQYFVENGDLVCDDLIGCSRMRLASEFFDVHIRIMSPPRKRPVGDLEEKQLKIMENTKTIDLTGLDMTGATNMGYMFSYFVGLTTINFANIDTSNITNMSGLFLDCISLRTINLSFNTSNVTNMSDMFHNCRKLEHLTLNGLDTSKVVNMNNMFAFCSSLKYLDLSDLDTSNVVSMEEMFAYCSSLKYLDLSDLDTSNVVSMEEMFRECTNLVELILSGPISEEYKCKFNTSKVTSMKNMFAHCNSLERISMYSFDVSNVKCMMEMFKSTKLEFMDFSKGSVGYNNAIFYSIKAKTVAYMFNNCKSLKYINLSTMRLDKVSDMSYMFSGCESLSEVVYDVNISGSKLNLFKAQRMQYMFINCFALKHLDIFTNHNMKSVKFEPTTSITLFWRAMRQRDLSFMFHCCPLTFIDIYGIDIEETKTEREKGEYNMKYIYAKYDKSLNCNHIYDPVYGIYKLI